MQRYKIVGYVRKESDECLNYANQGGKIPAKRYAVIRNLLSLHQLSILLSKLLEN